MPDPPEQLEQAIQPDCRQTRAVAAATDVSCSDVMKQAKCSASATAAASDQRNSPARDPAELPGLGASTGPAITADPMALRQKAMARALTDVAPSVAAMSGPDEATPRTPRAARKKFNVKMPAWAGSWNHLILPG